MSDLSAKLSQIKALALDCDGILSNCQIYYTGDGKWARSFSIRDGFGIKKLQAAGIPVTVITTSVSEDIQERMKTLGIHLWYEGAREKVGSWEDFLKHQGLQDHEVAYMGDDDPDIPLLKRAGFSATVPEAMANITEVVDYISKYSGGQGAVREICEMILSAKKG